jgi:hypothetical protein
MILPGKIQVLKSRELWLLQRPTELAIIQKQKPHRGFEVGINVTVSSGKDTLRNV